MVNKLQLLKKMLELDGSIKDYVILKKDKYGLYIEYAFCQGKPKYFRNLPKWIKELQLNKIYLVNKYSGQYWYFDQSTPIDIDELYMNKKFNITIPEFFEILKS